jgi:thymidylate kinase
VKLPRLIVFAGIDGSGKSTQADLLRMRLQSQGVRVASLWGRRVPWITKWPSRIFKRCILRESGKSDGGGYVAISRRRKGLLRYGIVRRLWSNALLLEYAVLMQYRLLTLGRGLDYLILDRYLGDALVDLAAAAPAPAVELRSLQACLAARLFRAPYLLVIVDLPAEMGWERKKDGTSLEYLKDRRPLYLALGASSRNARVLDGTLPPEAVSDAINQLLAQTTGGSTHAHV